MSLAAAKGTLGQFCCYIIMVGINWLIEGYKFKLFRHQTDRIKVGEGGRISGGPMAKTLPSQSREPRF